MKNYKIINCKNLNLSLTDIGDNVVDIFEQDDDIESLVEENKSLKETIDALLNVQYQLSKSNIELRKHLIDAKKTLKIYAETTCGELQPDGRYGIKVKDSTVFDGFVYVFFDPRPAIKALEDLKDVE